MPDEPEKDASSTGRIKVTLSSVAKTPPVAAPPKDPALTNNAPRGAILPPKEVSPKQAPGRPQLNRTMEVKLPPKTGVMPKLTTLSSMPLAPAAPKAEEPAPEPFVAPQIVPALKEETAPRKKRGLFPKLLLKPFRLKGGAKPEESIFPGGQPATADTPPPPLPSKSPPPKLPAKPEPPPLAPAAMPPAIPKVEPPELPRPAVPPLLEPRPGEKLPPPLKTTPPAMPPPLPKSEAAPKLASALRSEMLAPAPTGDSFILPEQKEEKVLPAAAKVTPEKMAPPVAEKVVPPVVEKMESPAPKAATPSLIEPGKAVEIPALESILAESKPSAEPLPSVPPLFVSRTKLEERRSAQVSEPPPPTSKSAAKNPLASPVSPEAKAAATRAARIGRRRLVSAVSFYIIFILLVLPALYFLAITYTTETRLEGQVIPPNGTTLVDEVWIVSDFRELASGIADDLAAERTPKLQEIQERQDHVRRAQSDIAAREERIRLLNEQIQGAKDEIATSIKHAHDSAQHIWDGPGAAIEDEYKSKLTALQNAITARAQSLKLNYTPDNTYQSPEVWANAYRIALYQTPAGVDGAKEHQWIEDQLKQWRAYTKTFDDQREKLRLQAAQIQLSPSAHINELNSRIDDLQHRVDSTQAEEDPLKTELAQAQADLAQSQGTESNLDPKYYAQLYALPESSITKRLPLHSDGRFTWPHMEKDSAFSAGEKSHSYWLFTRSVRKDGRQYWVMARITVAQNSVLPILVEPTSFVSTKAMLRPDLSPEEQAQ